MDGELWRKTQSLIDHLLADKALSIETEITRADIPLDKQEEVRKYLDVCRDTGSLLSSPGVSLRDHLDLTNRTLAGRYFCVRKIGRGGLGHVWLAHDLRLNRRSVALKLPVGGRSCTAEYVERLRSEIFALAKLDHPGIVKISDTDTTVEGHLFAVMEYVQGETLRQELTAGPWQPSRAIPVLRQLGKDLSYAHRNHVLHLDLKPENIMLRNLDTQEESVTIIDFGFGCVTESSDIPRNECTSHFAGSLDYLAPECFQGRYSTKSDIYSLGIIAIELLTGKFQAGGPDSDSAMHLSSEADIVLRKSTAREPDERYTCISDFVDRLTRAIEYGGHRRASIRSNSTPLSEIASLKQMEVQMNQTPDPSVRTVDGFGQDIEHLNAVRQKFGEYVSELADALTDAECENRKYSGELDLEKPIKDLRVIAGHLDAGLFRLMILGDMNRGKSSILNVLLKESVLPTAVTKCTALLTILRFGLDKRATVFFTEQSGKTPDIMTLAQFRERYTLSAAQTEQHEKDGQHAFPDVTHAVIEYPFPLLEKGVEIVDSPGLNDTIDRNLVTLGFIRTCHAVMFVFDAIHQVTLTERQYLRDHLLGQGQSIFFLLNKWDHIGISMLDPDDTAELKKNHDVVLQLFRSELAQFFDKDINGTFEERVFPLFTLEALKRHRKSPEASLEGTGFPEFLNSLSHFMEKERLHAELRNVRLMASGVYRTVHEKIALRIPLLDQSVEKLKAKIDGVQPGFRQLIKIRNEFRDQIDQEGNRKATQLADSMRRFLGNLVTTFESDFEPYQPELRLMDFFYKTNREEFLKSCKSGLDRYIMAKLASWVKDAEQELRVSFASLGAKGANHGQEYARVTDQITETLTGIRPPETSRVAVSEDKSPGWARWIAGVAAFMTGDMPGAVMATNGVFSAAAVFENVGANIVIQVLLLGVFGLALTPLGVILPALGVAGFQALRLKKKLAVAIREELEKSIPQIADAMWEPIYKGIQQCYASYHDLVIAKIDDDIHSRETELSNLLLQKQKGELDRTSEVERLKRLEEHALRMWQKIEAVEAGQLT